MSKLSLKLTVFWEGELVILREIRKVNERCENISPEELFWGFVLG